MSLSPWGMFGAGELSPFNDNFQPIDPFAAFASINRPLRRMERRMEREMGKMLSGIHEDDKSFEVVVDVSHFQPNEITVKTTDKNIIVHGKHEERTDQHGFVTREFRRRVAIPKGVNPEAVTSTLTPDGHLTIMAPKLALESGTKERVIPITMALSAGSATNQPGVEPTLVEKSSA